MHNAGSHSEMASRSSLYHRSRSQLGVAVWLEVPEGEGQAVVIVNAATETKHTYQTFYDGWGGWHPAGPGTRGFIEDYKLGSVVMTIFDAETKRAIWRGFATDALLDSPKQNVKAAEKALEAGGWALSGVTPEGGDVALQQALASKTVDLLDGVDPNSPDALRSLASGAPAIFISTRPAELIVTDGPMVFATIEGTSLQYATNTSADVFREPTAQELYLLRAGRWFRSWKAEGPWRLVASSELPAGFARIPDGSPRARVKASIAGTVEAR